MYLHHYVYAYLRSYDLSPYYIGKGKNNRAWKGKHSVSIPKDKTKIVIVESGLTNLGACAIERRLIRWYGRKDNNTGILHNRTDGGDGVSGAICTPKRKQEISAFWSGKPKPWASRPGISNTFYGKTHTSETKQQQSLAKQGTNNPMFGKTQGRVTCLHCKKETSVNGLVAHHKHQLIIKCSK